MLPPSPLAPHPAPLRPARPPPPASPAAGRGTLPPRATADAARPSGVVRVCTKWQDARRASRRSSWRRELRGNAPPRALRAQGGRMPRRRKRRTRASVARAWSAQLTPGPVPWRKVAIISVEWGGGCGGGRAGRGGGYQRGSRLRRSQLAVPSCCRSSSSPRRRSVSPGLTRHPSWRACAPLCSPTRGAGPQSRRPRQSCPPSRCSPSPESTGESAPAPCSCSTTIALSPTPANETGKGPAGVLENPPRGTGRVTCSVRQSDARGFLPGSSTAAPSHQPHQTLAPSPSWTLSS